MMLTYNMEARQGKNKYDFLYGEIKRDIVSGALRKGERLPSRRALAEHLGVSVITVETAYSQLVAEGYLDSRERSGFFVGGIGESRGPAEAEGAARPLPLSAPAREATGDMSAFQFSALRRVMRQVIADDPERLLQKPPHAGCPELRNAIARHLLRYRGMRADPRRIVIGSGAEYLYGLVAQLFGREMVYGIEWPSYEKIRLVYETYGARCELLPMDASGIASRSLRQTEAGVLHVTPFHSFPTGVSAPAAKRYEYIAWARKSGGYIVEDDFDSEFSLHRKPLETVFSMDSSGCVIYINTFTKSLAPSIRVGYMILPERLAARYEEKLGFYSCTVPAFDQYVLAEFIAQGYFERHLNRVRRALRQADKRD